MDIDDVTYKIENNHVYTRSIGYVTLMFSVSRNTHLKKKTRKEKLLNSRD